jgi:hypothetical protein
MQPQPRKSQVEIEFPPVALGCAPTVRITVTTPRKTKEPKVVDECFYALSEIPAFFGERAFRFDRLDFERKAAHEVRYVNPDWIECNCESGSMGKTPCKHAICVQKIIEAERYSEVA